MTAFGTKLSLYKRITGIPRKIFGTRNDRLIKTYNRHTPAVSAYEEELLADFDGRLAERMQEDGVSELPEEEQAGALQALRVELSQDLRDRTEGLQERIAPHLAPVETWWQSLTPESQREEHIKEEYRKRHAKVIETMDQDGLTAEGFGILREASRRAQAHRHFDCQLVGGRVLYEGKIAEMKTGEGKTIVCHLAAFLQVLSGHKVHVITVNDYLVSRDAEFAMPIFELVGISVGYIQAMVDPGGREGVRRAAYARDITYGTNSEFGFDYLRDNMKTSARDQVQGALHFVIVDEVDSILIDEARTPLIISGPAHDDVTRYPRADRVARELVRRQLTWDRKVRATVAKFDGNSHNIPKLEDAMRILGYRSSLPDTTNTATTDDDESEDSKDIAALGPDFLTDDQVEAIQFYESGVLNLPAAEQYRRYFIVQRERKSVGITHDGVTIAQELLDMGSLYAGANMEWPHLIENSLRAHKVYQCDVDYVVKEGQVIIVDPFTGRLMHGRQWSDGLHQAVEAAENVRVKEETQTLATITIQNFIKLYLIKAGMTGTASTEATEFDKIYKLDVIEIPTNRPVNRIDHNDKMYRDEEHKYNAIVDEIHEIHRRGRPADPFLLADVFKALRKVHKGCGLPTDRIDEALRQFNSADEGDKDVIRFMLETYDEAMGDLARGRPILVGTTSVENSEKLSRLLERRYGIDHEVLNAKNHAREAEIVMKAGYTSVPVQGGHAEVRGNVTVATNMAGRGTDIKLGEGVVYKKCKVPEQLPEGATGNKLYPAGITQCCIRCDEYDAETNCAHCFKPKIDPRFPALGRTVCPINTPCGLHIIGTERHESRRIDNQLRGRAGRQGDPGSSRFSLSLADDLLKLFMSEWMLKMMEKLGFSEGTSLEDKRLTKGIERAQRKVEERNYSTRKSLLEWDEPMDFQRKEFYTARQRILDERDLPGLIFDTILQTTENTIGQFLGGNYDRTCIVEWCRTKIDLAIGEEVINTDDLESAQRSIREKAKDEWLDQIQTSVGEYIDPDEPPNKWDVGGLLRWAERAFKISLTQNQLRKMQPDEIEETLRTAAERYTEQMELDGISIYLDSTYPTQALADWGRQKFNVRLEVDDLLDLSAADTVDLLRDRVHKAYREREIAYPVDACLDRAMGDEGTESAQAAEFIVRWVNSKYNAGWTLGDIEGKSLGDLRKELLDLSRAFFDGRLDEQIEEEISGKSKEQFSEWATVRFGPAWNQERFDRAEGDGKATVIEMGREMLRWELTRLEQYVLLRIYDQAWKDHLLEMDHLKTAIMQRPLGGDTSHPQSQYAIEGRELFTQMWSRIADRVTDIVFKVRAVSEDEAEGPAGGPKPMTFSHGDATGAGFSGTTRDQAAAMKGQGQEAKVETIRREQPRIKRNDPCPCGSGKKFKQCHGKTA